MMIEMRMVLTSMVLLGGCDRVFGLDRGDGGVDVALPCLGGQYSDNGGLFGVCLETAPPDKLPMTASIDTGVSGDAGNCTQIVTQSDAGKTEVCVVAAYRIEIATPVDVHGDRPLVLVAVGDLTIAAGGEIDASSRRAGKHGPAASSNECVAAERNGSDFLGGGGGGAGGTFGGPGGMGGQGGNNPAGRGGLSDVASSVGFLRGGCPGGSGGMSGSTLIAGGGGGAGGAVYLIAGGTIAVSGKVHASGAGGGGGSSAATGGSGGGGGGSGGLIALDAPVIVIAAGAALVANGGGGGGGGGNTADGGPGGEPNLLSDTFPFFGAGGAEGLPGGSRGGNGASGTFDHGDNGGNANAGAGGGGGGVGYIKLFTADRRIASVEITPPPNPP